MARNPGATSIPKAIYTLTFGNTNKETRTSSGGEDYRRPTHLTVVLFFSFFLLQPPNPRSLPHQHNAPPPLELSGVTLCVSCSLRASMYRTQHLANRLMAFGRAAGVQSQHHNGGNNAGGGFRSTLNAVVSAARPDIEAK